MFLCNDDGQAKKTPCEDCDNSSRCWANGYRTEEPKRLVPRIEDHQGELPLSQRFAEKIEWMETESKFAHACPDLDQEHLPSDHMLAQKLPADPAKRKAIPLCRGLLDYFPDACAAVAEVSRVGCEQHHIEPMRWVRGISMDQEDCIIRHLIDRGKLDTDGLRHTAKVAWRALALLQLEIEAG